MFTVYIIQARLLNFCTAIRIIKTQNFCKEDISFKKTNVHLPSFYTLHNFSCVDNYLDWNMKETVKTYCFHNKKTVVLSEVILDTLKYGQVLAYNDTGSHTQQLIQKHFHHNYSVLLG
jgi:hypothetical protein